MEIRKFEGEFWVKAEDILRMIENLRKTNDMYRYSADELFSMLEEVIERGERDYEDRSEI